VGRIVLADATTLIGLAKTEGGLSWLKKLFGKVFVTSVVKGEVLPGRGVEGEAEIQKALDRGIIRELTEQWPEPLFPWLHEGEASIIRAAVNLEKAGNDCLILMDEKHGRAAVKALGSSSIVLIGTAAVIGRAKEKELIPSAAAVFHELRHKGFYISQELVRGILDEIGEKIEGPPARSKGKVARVRMTPRPKRR
jgi:predicted nucleic acid-binding protein